MTENNLQKVIKQFFDDLSEDIAGERVLKYIIREIDLGRLLSDILRDPYVKNRLSEEKVEQIISRPEIIQAVEEKIEKSFKGEKF